MTTNKEISDLYVFLMQSNPKIKNFFLNKPQIIEIDVSYQKVSELEGIFSKIDPSIIEGKNQYSIALGGGKVGNGVDSVDPQPHTTFILTISKDFYNQISDIKY